jgi:hypothetical protein
MPEIIGTPLSNAPNLLEDAAAIWRFLLTSGGLDPEFYDRQTVDDLRERLGLPADEDLAQTLESRRIGTEDLIKAFFSAVEPFTQMMSDILQMFAAAGAKQSAHNMQVRFDFDRKMSLSFDLEQFRMWFSTWEKVRELQRVREWDYNSLWGVWKALRSEIQLSNDLMGAAGTAAESWAHDYMERLIWPRQIPEPPESGVEDLNQILRQAWQLWSFVVRAWARISPDRRQLRELMNQEEARERNSHWSPRLLAFLDSDHWGASVAAGLYGTAETARRMPPSQEKDKWIQQKISALNPFFSQGTGLQEVETWVELLQSFLNLPAWKRRHELYSVWIATQILRGALPTEFRIHVVDQRLHFSFGGTHFATAGGMEPELHLWAELRSPLTVPPLGKGRKGKIQPDYTLVRNPITDPGSAVLVVECKQYRTSSTENFLHALVDYAHGRPDAVVALVNYGPARREILQQVPDELRPRVFLIGDVRPGSAAAVEEFHNVVRSAIAAISPRETAASSVVRSSMVQTASTLRSVGLAWGDRIRDLDLSLEITRGGSKTVLDFHQLGSTREEPWAALDHDDRQGPGQETITLARILPDHYRFMVFNYSNESQLADSGATVTLDQGESRIDIHCPHQGAGRWWHVLDLDGGTGRIEIVNALLPDRP